MENSENQQALLLESKISEKNQPRVRKVKVKKVVRRTKINANVSCEFNVLNQRNPEVRIYSVSRSHKKIVQPNEFLRPAVQQKLIANLKSKISLLESENDLSKRNFQSEIEFHLKKHFTTLLTLQQLLIAKQYQRLSEIIDSEVTYFKKFYQSFSNSDEDTYEGLTLSRDSMETIIEEDPSFMKLISNLQENLKGIPSENINLLPQIKKLSKEENISPKKLAWFFSTLPFELPEKEQCHYLAIKIIQQLKFDKGEQILHLIMKKYTLSLIQGQKNDKENSIMNYVHDDDEDENDNDIRRNDKDV